MIGAAQRPSAASIGGACAVTRQHRFEPAPGSSSPPSPTSSRVVCVRRDRLLHEAGTNDAASRRPGAIPRPDRREKGSPTSAACWRFRDGSSSAERIRRSDIAIRRAGKQVDLDDPRTAGCSASRWKAAGGGGVARAAGADTRFRPRRRALRSLAGHPMNAAARRSARSTGIYRRGDNGDSTWTIPNQAAQLALSR